YKIKPRCSDFRMTGRAWTLKYGPGGIPVGTVGDYIDDVKPGEVVVLDNDGRDDATVWGDIDRTGQQEGYRRYDHRRYQPRRVAVPGTRLSGLQPRIVDAHRQGPRAGGSHPGAGEHRRRAGLPG